MTLLLIFILSLNTFTTTASTPQKVFDESPCEKTVFSFTMMSADSCPQRNAWSAMMQNEFPKGCIGIDKHLSLDWLTYTARSIYYDVSDIPDKRVPLFDDGGYDLGFVGSGGATLPDFLTDFHSNSTLDVGYNWYNYQNSTLDGLLESYEQDTNFDTRDVTARKIQRILYEDQPSMMLVEDEKVYAYNPALEGFGPDAALAFSTYNAHDSYKLLGFEGEPDRAVVYAHSYTTSEFSPWSSGNSAIGALYQNAIFQSLYQEWGADMRLQPLLAKGPLNISTDGITITVTLNENATFANGNGVRAEDIYDSFLRFLDPSYSSTQSSIFHTRFGNPLDPAAENYRPLDDIIQIITPGIGGRLVFTLSSPYFAADRLFTFPVVDSRIWGAWNNTLVTYDTNEYVRDNYQGPIGLSGSGPFVYSLIDWTSGNVTLKQNANYWNGPVRAPFLKFQFYGQKATALSDLEAGVVDIVDANLKPSLNEIANFTGVTYALLPAYGWQQMFVNMQHPIFGTGLGTPLGQKDPSRAAEAARYVRQAMSHLVPRSKMVKEILQGLGRQGASPWIYGWMHYDDSLKPYEYSISKAKELLAKAGYETWNYVGETIPVKRMTVDIFAVMGVICILLFRRKIFSFCHNS